jgi:hypothetical protein
MHDLFRPMTFDEQLKGAFDTITDLLREEISRQVQVVVEELKESAHTDREQAVTDAREAAARDADEREAAAVAIAEARGREQGEALGREQGEARGREHGQAEGRLQAEEAGRAAIDAALAARAVEPRPDGASNERLVEAVRSISRARSLSEILDTLLSGVGREAARAVVLLVRGERVHGWRFVGFDPAIDAQSFVLSLDDTGLMAVAVRTKAAVNNVSGEGGEIASAPAFAALPSGRECLAVPIALSDQVVAVLYADQGSADAEPAAGWMDAVEVLVRHAALSLEAMTAFKAARALMARADSPEATGSGASDGAGAEEDASARRYARLLVSEIKLYHEAAVVAGRRDRDLGTRLSGEIARARVLYEQRVPPPVRQRADYFHDELVRTLADGDAGLLEVGS